MSAILPIAADFGMHNNLTPNLLRCMMQIQSVCPCIIVVYTSALLLSDCKYNKFYQIILTVVSFFIKISSKSFKKMEYIL